MDKFQVILPSVLLAPYVKQYWFLTLENVTQNFQRLVPFGCAALSFHRGDRSCSSFDNCFLPSSYLSGIATDYRDIELAGNIDLICIIFQPTGFNAFFQFPIHALYNRQVSVDSLDDFGLRELEQQLHETTDDLRCVRFIERFLLRRIYQFDKGDNKRMEMVIHSIYEGKTDINQLAEAACLSYKQFKRVFTNEVGSNPKEFLKIVRFQKLHRLLQQHSSMTVTQLAYECGYYDKSHLIKELKAFSGFTPVELQKVCDPVYSSYHALFRSAFVDLPFK